jgi:WD40 repeat protein
MLVASGSDALAFSPDGRLLAGAAGDQTVMLWNPATGELVQQIPGHAETIYDVAFAPDGKLLASGGIDNLVSVWKIPAPQETK